MFQQLTTLNEVREVNASFPYTGPIKAWKEQGKKVVAFQHGYVPEEIIHAAGILPIGLTGLPTRVPVATATAYMSTEGCTYCRSCPGLVLKKDYELLDGFVAEGNCDSTQLMGGVWRYYKLTPFVPLIATPCQATPAAQELYQGEMVALRQGLEEFFGVKVTDEALWRSVQVYDRTRELLGKLQELMKRDAPPVSGSEMIEVMNAGLKMPREQFNTLLERLLDEAGRSARQVGGNVRLMLVGATFINAEFIRMMEELGGVVVVADHYFGVRYGMGRGKNGSASDPIGALSRHYLSNFPTPRMQMQEDRFAQVAQLAKEYRVQGVVSAVMRGCTPYGYEQPFLKRALERQGVRSVELDADYAAEPSGMLKVRLQAFLEMLGTE